ncbi:RING-H2 finger protein ATL56-like [Lolium rigidum]|uniref:RING-H2 finger protein ATL56-like n=1 Tax=Lolium rigidum TaxID=89674 RepID=UPI001F5DB6D9|nr:RING-H2 finger protein ATL56-like [Lolium rigidum]
MDADDVLDWFLWGFLMALLVLLALSAALVLVVVIAELVRHVRKRCQLLSVERLLKSIPDVAYRQIPDRDGGAASAAEEEEDKELRRSQSSCVICMAQYEAGERCSVLPGCGHVFHRGCFATWLHTTRTTCPLCRATIGADAVPRKGNAAENMV